MGLARDALKKLKTRVMSGMGEKLVSVLADTSSDAPTRFSAPKRDLYEKLYEQEKDSPKASEKPEGSG
jgi:hypothetical protein